MAYVAQGQVPLGPAPTTIVCPHCQNHVTSMVDTTPTSKTHLFCIVLCLFGCCLCAPCVYCADSCLATKHTCPKCHQYLGIYEK